MGKPRMIILIRHAQSEGNKNRDIHQTIPDHRVKLTAEGWKQAAEAGRKLRSQLRPTDTLHFFTSPYRRTRETTEGIIASLTSCDPTPSPFSRSAIRVYEEPRLREQDFGNFQPGSAEMARMWQERASYGHFFYRIPNGESAADAYDRISGFNESLWRSFGEDDFPSVCVLVTHGLMTRVFLMKWYHFSVEYFEDLRNINHCEFIVMKLNPKTGKYVLQNKLRTWSELKKEEEQSRAKTQSPIPVRKRWGDKQDERDAQEFERRQFARRQNTAEYFADEIPSALSRTNSRRTSRAADIEKGLDEDDENSRRRKSIAVNKGEDPVSGTNGTMTLPLRPQSKSHKSLFIDRPIMMGGRDGGGSDSGLGSPTGLPSDEAEILADLRHRMGEIPTKRSLAMALHGELDPQAGMNEDARADALGDQSDASEDNAEIKLG